MSTDLKSKAISLSNISLHNNSKVCWIVINARVYDVTNFLNDHPGGDKVLLDVVGKDASKEFEEVGHGSAARLMLDEFYVGEANVVTPSDYISTTTTSKARTHPKQQTIVQEDKQSTPGFKMKPVRVLLPLAIIGVAIAFVLYK